MKKIILLLFVLYIAAVSGQGKRFFESGVAELKNPVEKINLTYIHQIPLVKVWINNKSYQFIFDTGAPTVISTEIYNELNLKKKYRTKVGDSQKNKQKQIFTKLPEMKVDNIIFTNIGAIVIDLKSPEFGCMKIDGIVGANQMAKLFWRINYSENLIEATNDFNNFSTEGYETIFGFKPKSQKTPVIESEILGRNIDLMFDTGFTGKIKISENNYDPKNEKIKFVEMYGANSVGAFGAGKPISSYIFKVDDIMVEGQKFENEIIMTGNSNLIGNEFFERFKFILDWENNKIYMQRIKNNPVKLESFGFGYRFIDLKAVVVMVFREKDFPLKTDDIILSINNVSFENLNEESSCHYFLNRVEKETDSIDIKVKRDGKVLDFKLDKKEYLK